ncbi:histidine phosphatase family protein [Pleomorphomonas sp. NRK KF1]|uniref:SixA phosphatase family protein n=1 Tax=Pleomorphomonas sp. NRK KF1 TaxID=2943000 RepID=UPI0020445691|nr:histidine phosphatase family protein [Pleomorphomonas sp. NRK KF1]MCM5555626.1 histidine phosphatase family protein [Pleomorphomonas sp. NRK KF1]
MPRLFLLRHAKSPPAVSGQKDFDRPLTARGREAAPAVGRHMADEGYVPDLVLCSPSARTRETLDGVKPFLPERVAVDLVRDLYEASVGAMLKVIATHADRSENLLVVGHNPSIHRLASTLPGEGDPALMKRLSAKFPTASLAVIEFSGAWSDLGPGDGRLISFVTPADLGGPDGD